MTIYVRIHARTEDEAMIEAHFKFPRLKAHYVTDSVFWVKMSRDVKKND